MYIERLGSFRLKRPPFRTGIRAQKLFIAEGVRERPNAAIHLCWRTSVSGDSRFGRVRQPGLRHRFVELASHALIQPVRLVFYDHERAEGDGSVVRGDNPIIG